MPQELGDSQKEDWENQFYAGAILPLLDGIYLHNARSLDKVVSEIYGERGMHYLSILLKDGMMEKRRTGLIRRRDVYVLTEKGSMELRKIMSCRSITR